MEVINSTPFAAAVVHAQGADGDGRLQITIKATFSFAGMPAGKQEAIVDADAFTGEPGASSLAAVTDLGWGKPGTDILLFAEALAPRAETRQCEVALAVGPVRKSVRVIGDRRWRRRLFGVVASDPLPFTTMPLTWERAFGGSATTRDGTLLMDERNPVGTGFSHPDAQDDLAERRLPNLEDPGYPLATPKDHPDPVGVAPICPHWLPRRRHAGTYDERWSLQRAPAPPADFDPRFLQCAPADQVVPGHLKGDEEVVLEHIAPLGSYRFRLPGGRLRVAVSDGATLHELATTLETVALHPGSDRMILTWRAEAAEAADAIARVTIGRDG
ncbi:MAG: DUF2169 domain-containing protein [Planctomycetes bacterium]|nr:DUF2169 domain-containing protein [Planctomycetota bacterium]